MPKNTTITKNSSGSLNGTEVHKEGQGPFLLEVAWEVCNQVGGIYTVIRSKIPATIQKWKGSYCMIGPLLDADVSAEFEDIVDFENDAGPWSGAVMKMRNMGFEVRYGHWLVTGKPRVILLKPLDVFDKLEILKRQLFEQYGIEYRKNDTLYDQVVAFCELVTVFLKLFMEEVEEEDRVITHFHEWMTCIPIAYINKEHLAISTVFTTHATLLGRYLAMNKENFYANLDSYDWQREAKEFNITPMVQAERLGAHSTDVFTTVSEVTARECKHLLGVEPTIILPNGLNIERFVAFHEVQNLHQRYKEKINQFVMGHFFHCYPFDLDDTLYFFTSGRYEYKNKGYDVTLEALSLLNVMMKEAGMKVNVVAFFITKQPVWSINPEVLQTRAIMEEIRQNCNAILKQLEGSLFHAAVSSEDESSFPDLNEFVEEYWKLRYRRTIQSWKSKQWPIIITHNMVNDVDDEILNYLRGSRLINGPKDNVKIVYHPDFITPTSPLFGMEYGDFVRGCHLGIFPSYYEPWGYTPLECIARGVPTVTSDLSGFGDYVMKNTEQHQDKGVFVMQRYKKDFKTSARELAEYLFEFTKSDRRHRMVLRSKAEDFSEFFDWSNLINAYEIAYTEALEKTSRKKEGADTENK